MEFFEPFLVPFVPPELPSLHEPLAGMLPRAGVTRSTRFFMLYSIFIVKSAFFSCVCQKFLVLLHRKSV